MRRLVLFSLFFCLCIIGAADVHHERKAKKLFAKTNRFLTSTFLHKPLLLPLPVPKKTLLAPTKPLLFPIKTDHGKKKALYFPSPTLKDSVLKESNLKLLKYSDFSSLGLSVLEKPTTPTLSQVHSLFINRGYNDLVKRLDEAEQLRKAEDDALTLEDKKLFAELMKEVESDHIDYDDGDHPDVQFEPSDPEDLLPEISIDTDTDEVGKNDGAKEEISYRIDIPSLPKHTYKVVGGRDTRTVQKFAVLVNLGGEKDTELKNWQVRKYQDFIADPSIGLYDPSEVITITVDESMLLKRYVVSNGYGKQLAFEPSESLSSVLGKVLRNELGSGFGVSPNSDTKKTHVEMFVVGHGNRNGDLWCPVGIKHGGISPIDFAKILGSADVKRYLVHLGSCYSGNHLAAARNFNSVRGYQAYKVTTSCKSDEVCWYNTKTGDYYYHGLFRNFAASVLRLVSLANQDMNLGEAFKVPTLYTNTTSHQNVKQRHFFSPQSNLAEGNMPFWRFYFNDKSECVAWAKQLLRNEYLLERKLQDFPAVKCVK